MASEQKTSLQNLFHDKCRPCLGSWPQVREGGRQGERSGTRGRFLPAFIPLLKKKNVFHLQEGPHDHPSLGPGEPVPAPRSRCLCWGAGASTAYTCVVPRCDFPRLAALARRPAKDTRERLVCQHSCRWPGVSQISSDNIAAAVTSAPRRTETARPCRWRRLSATLRLPSRAGRAFAAGRTKFTCAPASAYIARAQGRASRNAAALQIGAMVLQVLSYRFLPGTSVQLSRTFLGTLRRLRRNGTSCWLRALAPRHLVALIND